MSTLEATKYLPLLIDREGMPIPVPANVHSLIVRKATKGRPRQLGENGGDLVLSAEADMNDLLQAIDNKPGRFLMYPRDADGRSLPQHGYVTVSREHVGVIDETEPDETAMVPVMFVLDQMSSLLDRMLTALESNILIQQQTIELLSNRQPAAK